MAQIKRRKNFTSPTMPGVVMMQEPLIKGRNKKVPFYDRLKAKKREEEILAAAIEARNADCLKDPAARECLKKAQNRA